MQWLTCQFHRYHMSFVNFGWEKSDLSVSACFSGTKVNNFSFYIRFFISSQRTVPRATGHFRECCDSPPLWVQGESPWKLELYSSLRGSKQPLSMALKYWPIKYTSRKNISKQHWPVQNFQKFKIFCEFLGLGFSIEASVFAQPCCSLESSINNCRCMVLSKNGIFQYKAYSTTIVATPGTSKETVSGFIFGKLYFTETSFGKI